MTRCEYVLLDYDREAGVGVGADQLNRMAEDGWRVFSVQWERDEMVAVLMERQVVVPPPVPGEANPS